MFLRRGVLVMFGLLTWHIGHSQTKASFFLGRTVSSSYHNYCPLTESAQLVGSHLGLGFSHKLKHAPFMQATEIRFTTHGQPPLGFNSVRYTNLAIPICLLVSVGDRNNWSIGPLLFGSINFQGASAPARFLDLSPMSFGLGGQARFSREITEKLYLGIKATALIEQTSTFVSTDIRTLDQSFSRYSISIQIQRKI